MATKTRDGRRKLTAGRIRDFKCGAGVKQAFLWDSDVRQLAVRATAGGSKSFVFQTRQGARSLRLTIGSVETWAIDAARAEARRLQQRVDCGIDPRQERAEQLALTEAKAAAAKRRRTTVGEAWTEYLEDRRPHWSDAHYRDHVRRAQAPGQAYKRGPGETTAGPLYPLMRLPLADLNAAALAQWVQTETAGRATATAQSFRLLRAFLRWVAGRPEVGQLSGDIDDLLPRRVRQEVAPVRARADCLQREQLAPWFAAVRQAEPITSAYLQTLLLTGARPGEPRALRWIDISFQWRFMTIRDKMEGDRTVPLTPHVAALLAALPRRNEFVFTSKRAGSGHLEGGAGAHNRALIAAGLPPMTLHGLRRSFGTLSEWCEVPVGVTAQLMGHKPSALAEKHYRRRPLDLLRLWHVRIEGWILEQAGLAQPAEGAAAERLRVVR